MSENERNDYINPEMPRDIDSEKAVLNVMLTDSESAEIAIDILIPEDFYMKEHQEIFRAVKKMYFDGVQIDTLTVYSRLEEMKSAEVIGGRGYLYEITQDIVNNKAATDYAKNIIKKAKMRRLIAAANDIRSAAFDGTEDPEMVLDAAERTIYNIAAKQAAKDYQQIGQVLENSLIEIENTVTHKGKAGGVKTGFNRIDSIVGGFKPGQMIVLAARPGMGKTALALNVAVNAARDEKTVLIFSMEMTNIDLGNRFLSMSSNIDLQSMGKGDLSPEDMEMLVEGMESLGDKNIYMADTQNLTILDMKNKCRRLKKEKGLDLIIIDYLQLMNAPIKSDNREREISYLSRSVKQMAIEIGVPIILLSQLSREVEKRKKHTPQLADLRESGAIEQDADIVMFIKREDYYEGADDEAFSRGSVNAEVMISKNRNGPTGKAELAWIGQYTKFGNLEIEDI